jgi:hypothetical protein
VTVALAETGTDFAVAQANSGTQHRRRTFRMGGLNYSRAETATSSGPSRAVRDAPDGAGVADRGAAGGRSVGMPRCAIGFGGLRGARRAGH